MLFIKIKQRCAVYSEKIFDQISQIKLVQSCKRAQNDEDEKDGGGGEDDEDGDRDDDDKDEENVGFV